MRTKSKFHFNQTEEEAVAAVREAQKEVAEGKIVYGDLREILKNMKNERERREKS